MIGESKAARLAQQLQDYIDDSELVPGTHLGTKASLLAAHHVSAGTLNEAMRLLQVRGYIDVRPGPKGGAFVADQSSRVKLSHTLVASQDDPLAVNNYFQVQDALHYLICVEAAAACTPDDAGRIQGAVDQMNTAKSASEILTAIWEVDREIALTVTNPALCQIYLGVLDAIQTSIQRFPLSRRITDDTVHVHQDVAMAVMQNDIGKAGEAARRHSPIDYGEILKKKMALTS